MFWVAVVQHLALHDEHVDTRVMFVTYVRKERIPSEKIFPNTGVMFVYYDIKYAGVCTWGYDCMCACVCACVRVCVHACVDS